MQSNVINLARHQQQAQAHPSDALGTLLSCFAKHRRHPDEVYWLKENAEILNILECTQTDLPEAALSCFDDFYQSLEERFDFFPQYYRFLCSIALDLESLGMEGDMGERLCAKTRQAGLSAAELSDLQRAEAVRLLARRGFALDGTAELLGRLHRFAQTSASFALPNYKAAYELTHIVFYLSEYGRRDPRLSAEAVRSLIYAGLVAHLEENADLLAEICVSLRYAGQVPPAAWEALVLTQLGRFQQGAWRGDADDYHQFLVGSWASATMGRKAFTGNVQSGGVSFVSGHRPLGALQALSKALQDWPGARSPDWEVMRKALATRLPPPILAHLDEVSAATSEFGGFFEIFVRAQHGRSQRQPLCTVAPLERAP